MMKETKKLLALLLAGVMLTAVTACGGEKTDSNQKDEDDKSVGGMIVDYDNLVVDGMISFDMVYTNTTDQWMGFDITAIKANDMEISCKYDDSEVGANSTATFTIKIFGSALTEAGFASLLEVEEITVVGAVYGGEDFSKQGDVELHIPIEIELTTE